MFDFFRRFLIKGRIINLWMKEFNINLRQINYFDYDILSLKNGDYYRINKREELLATIHKIEISTYGKEVGNAYRIRKLGNSDYFYIKQDF